MTTGKSKIVRIGGACGYWGESDMAWGQLLGTGSLDYLVFDYLAEITMSLLARMRARHSEAGYVPDFVSQLARYLPEIAEQKVRIISNAGGINPQGCADAIRTAIDKAGLDLTVSVITGDDLMPQLDRLQDCEEMFSAQPFPISEHIASANAYLGAFPIARALTDGADIVITGRCVDSAVTLGALIHEFGWKPDDLDKLAQGSLIGHLIECGPQVTGGNFTDWRDIADSLTDIGYPIAEVSPDGSVLISKPAGTGGLVSVGTVTEQMLYEIGDPHAYIMPDVVCDFTQVSIEPSGPDQVRVRGARGRGVPDQYKVSVTVQDGYRLSALFFMTGTDAPEKARIVFDSTLARARQKLRAMNIADYSQAELEITGNGSAFGDSRPSDDIAFRISVRHEEAKACALILKEASGFGLATPPGLSLFSGGRPKPQPVVRLFSTLIDKDQVTVRIDGVPFHGTGKPTALTQYSTSVPSDTPYPPETKVPLETLAWLRSGDKGDTANIGVIARKADYLPYIWAALDEAAIREHFAHFVEGEVRRWYLPGPKSINILMDQALGGGGMASLRNDPQGKAFGQILAGYEVPVPKSLM